MMRYNILQYTIPELFQRLFRYKTNGLLSPLVVVSLCLYFISGCTAHYQGPLRFGGNSSEQNSRNVYREHINSIKDKLPITEYIIDTLYVIDTIIEECTLDTFYNNEPDTVYESCPVVFNENTTGRLLIEAEKILRPYFTEIIKGNPILKQLFSRIMELLEIYLPDLLDRALEILALDELIEKQRYPEVRIYDNILQLMDKYNPEKFSSVILLPDYYYNEYPDSNYILFNKPDSRYSKEISALKGMDIVQ